MASQLAIKNVTKKYDGQSGSLKVLSKVSISADKEEFVCIIGPNGSGKSTILKVMAGIEPPTTGIIKNTAKKAYLPQGQSLLPWRNIENNLMLPADISNTNKDMARAEARELLANFGLLKFADFYPHQLSGGMQQKVSLLRAIIDRPDYLLVDEPFSSIDAITRFELQDWILDLKQTRHFGVICVTHDIKEAIRLADTIYVLSDRPGRIIEKFSKRSSSLKNIDLESELYKLLVGTA